MGKKAKAVVQIYFETGDGEIVGKTISVNVKGLRGPCVAEFAKGRTCFVADATGSKPIWSTAKLCHGGRCENLR